PAPRARPAKATVRARPTWPIVRPSGRRRLGGPAGPRMRGSADSPWSGSVPFGVPARAALPRLTNPPPGSGPPGRGHGRRGGAGGKDRPEVVRGGCGDPQSTFDDDEEQAEDRHHPDEAELLAESREREVRVDLRDRQVAVDRRQSGAEPGPDETPAGERVQRL